MTVRFDSWELDYGQRRLFRAGEEVHLSPKALQLLNLLVGKSPNAVSKQEINDELWPSTFVSEANLPSIVLELRTAFADDARHPRYIRTVHGYGYAFTAPLSRTDFAAQPARYRIIVQGQEIPLAAGANEIGRAASASIFIDDASISREHARIVEDNGRVTLEDLGSKNGTSINGVRVTTPTLLADRDIITVGSVAITFRDRGVSQSTVTMH